MRWGIPASASASSKTGWKRRFGATCCALGNERASAGRDGVGSGCTKPCDCSMVTGFADAVESHPGRMGPISLGAKQTGERSAGNLPAAFDEARLAPIRTAKKKRARVRDIRLPIDGLSLAN